MEGSAATDRVLPDLAKLRTRIADSGPGAADVLRALVNGASGLLDAPARLAMLRAGRLEWVLAQDDGGLVVGSPVATNNTPCGDAWRQGEPALLTERPAPCLGNPEAAVVVPVVLPATSGGRRADARTEVCALLALTGAREGWFDEADLATVVELTGIAAGRLAELVAAATPSRGIKEPSRDHAEAVAGSDPGEGRFPPDHAEGALETRAPEPEEPQDEGGQSFAGWFGAETPAPTRPVPRLKPRTTKTVVLRIPTQPTRDDVRVVVRKPALPAALPAAESMGLWQWDAKTGECSWSTPVARLLGLPPTAKLDLDLIREAIDEPDRARFDIAVKAITSGRGVAGAVALTGKDGVGRQAYAWSEVRRGPDGDLLGAWGGVVDVSTFHHDVGTTRNAVAGLRAAQELAGLATWEWHPETQRLLWSDEMYRLIGVSADVTPTPELWHSFVHPEDLERVRRLTEGGERVETFRLIGPGGEIRHVQCWATGGDDAVFGATIDVTRQVQDRIALERLNGVDAVTGLANRQAFDRRLAEVLAKPGPPVTVMLLDLDRFRAVNDGLGHPTGDRLLIEVARRLTHVVPDGAFVARTGGDEFAVLPPAGLAETAAAALAERLVEALRTAYELPETGEMLLCPASLGMSRNDRRRVEGPELFREADLALHRAKEAGRVVLFDDAMREAAATRVRVERRLRTAVDDDLLLAWYRPVTDFAHGRVVGAQASVRLRDPDGGPGREDPLTPPELFTEVAERTGLVVQLDAWLVGRVIEQVQEWDDGPWVSVRLSSRSLDHPGVVRRLVEAVQRGEIGADRVRVEIAEAALARTSEVALRRLIAAGIKVGIDGFGTGFAGLTFLAKLGPAFVKVAPGFVAAVGDDDRAEAVVGAIVDVAHAHDLQVVADGVESGRQARRLRELGCDLAQGDHFGRAGEASRIVRG